MRRFLNYRSVHVALLAFFLVVALGTLSYAGGTYNYFINLATQVTGTLLVANGGTGRTTVCSNGQVPLSNGTVWGCGSPGGTSGAGGSDRQVQFNDATTLNGTSLLTVGTSSLSQGLTTFTAKPTFVTAGTTTASLNIPLGAAPSSPVSGDLWNTSAGMYVRIGTTTVGPLAAGSNAFSSGISIGTGTPSPATQSLYSNGNNLYWNGHNLLPMLDPRDYGATCSGETYSGGLPVHNDASDDTAGFVAAMNASIDSNGTTKYAVLVPSGCWVANLLIPASGIVMKGQGDAINYGYDYNGNGAPYTGPVLNIIGHPAYGINLNGKTNLAFVGFEVSGKSDPSAYGVTAGIGGTSGSAGFGSKIWSMQMSYKNFLYGVRPSGGYVYFVSQNSDYGANATGLAGTVSDFYSFGDTFVSSGTGLLFESGNGQFARILNGRFEYNETDISGTAAYELSIDNTQFDHSTNCHISLTNYAEVNITNSAFRGGGLYGSLTVTGAANNGSGLIRLTIASTVSPALAGVVTNDHMTVAGVTGTTEANGDWVVTKIDSTHLDLVGSTFTHTYSSGGYAGVWGKDANICLSGASSSKGVHLVNNLYINMAAVSGNSAPAYVLDTTTANNDYIDVRGGYALPYSAAGSNAGTSYSVAFANWESFGAPAHVNIDVQGTPRFKNDSTVLSVNTSGGVGIGTATPNAGVALDMGSTTGALLLPVGTTGQEPTPAVGMIRYNSTTSAFEGYQGASPAWAALGGSSIPYPSGTGITLVSGGASWGTTIALGTSTTTYLRNDGAFQVLPGSSINSTYETFGITVDGGASVPATGAQKVFRVPYAGTITGWTLIGSASCSAVFDVWKVSGAIPTVSNTITASAKPTLSSQQFVNSTTLTGWTTSVSLGDVFRYNLDSISTCTWVTLQINITKS